MSEEKVKLLLLKQLDPLSVCESWEHYRDITFEQFQTCVAFVSWIQEVEENYIPLPPGYVREKSIPSLFGRRRGREDIGGKNTKSIRGSHQRQGPPLEELVHASHHEDIPEPPSSVQSGRGKNTA
jgi:hypothetical protein